MKHQECFEELIAAFHKDVQLQYLDTKKKIFAFTDTHLTGVRAMLVQGDTIKNAKSVAFALQTTTW